MTNRNTTSRTTVIALMLGLLGFSACAQDGADLAETAGNTSLAAPTATEPDRRSPVAMRIERALRDVELGASLPAAIESLRGAIDDPSATSTEKDEASLALSRALESSGDHEGAIVAVERLLASHAAGDRWAQEEPAHARLRFLLTGSEERPRRNRRNEHATVAPIAHVLATAFRQPAGRDTEINLQVFGGDRDTSDLVGTFEMAGAIRSEAREACPLCDDEPRTHTHSSYYSDWSAIPGARADLRNALVVFFFDLADRRIPARYDDVLPMPSDEIAARLANGRGLIVARRRPDAPPVLLVAAPRAGQLETVERTLAAMTALPESPVEVDVPATLLDEEVHDVLRQNASALRACFVAANVEPRVHREATFALDIGADGSPTSASVRSNGAPLADPSLDGCLVSALRAMRFPEARSTTSLTVPVGGR